MDLRGEDLAHDGNDDAPAVPDGSLVIDLAPERVDASQDIPAENSPDTAPDATPDVTPDSVTTADSSSDAATCVTHFSVADIGCILGDDLTPVSTSVAASATVLSMDDAAADGCAGLANPSAAPGSSSGGGPAKRIVLSAGARRWTVYARIPEIPPGILSVGDQLDLTVTASSELLFLRAINQTVVLARNQRLILFVSNLRSPLGGQIPMLDAYGIAVRDDGVMCEASVGVSCCSFRTHRTSITTGGQTTTLLPGQTATLGNLSFTVEAFLTAGANQCCDGLHPTQMAGFTRP